MECVHLQSHDEGSKAQWTELGTVTAHFALVFGHRPYILIVSKVKFPVSSSLEYI